MSTLGVNFYKNYYYNNINLSTMQSYKENNGLIFINIYYPLGIVILNSLPLFNSVFTSIFPLCFSMIF